MSESGLRVQDIDWPSWVPQQRATLIFVIRDGQVLLIRKKKGLGAGKINGPGGRIGSEETPQQGAIREIKEELRVRPLGVQQRGELRFQFLDGLSLHVWVFTATGCVGRPQETDEADPLWVETDAIPYGQMWADDAHWMPAMLAGKNFDGRFVFDGDRLLDYELHLDDEIIR